MSHHLRNSETDQDDDDNVKSGSRPQWSGTIGFGIVSIPVRMFSATRDHALHFHQISRADARRIRYRKVAEGSDQEVPADDIVKGYRLSDGRYVVFEKDELERLAAQRSQHLEIEAFVDLTEVDPRHFERSYHLMPAGKQGGRPYRLLSEALARSNRAGIAKLVLHNKEHLVAVRSLMGYLTLQTMHFIDELVEPRSVGALPPTQKISAKELEVADKLIAGMSATFDPSAYHDDHTARLQKAIKRKAQGRTLQVDEPEKELDDGKVLNLMEALKRSLARVDGKRKTSRSVKAKVGSRSPRRAG